MQQAEDHSRGWALITGSLISEAQAQNWSRLLVRDHLSPQARLALFQTCRDGKDLVLGAAERVVIKPTLAADEDQLDMLATRASLRAVKSALLTRGNLRTTLHLTANTPWLLAMVPGLLGESMAWLDGLDLRVPPEQRLPTPIIAAFAHACPNLRNLVVRASPEALPRPQLFTKLVYLDFRIHPGSEEAILPTIAPYMGQLTTLSPIYEQQSSLLPQHLPLLFNPANMAANLRVLSIHATLDDTLLGLLLECAPALTYLKVVTLQLAADTHAQSQATWQELYIVLEMDLSSLARLPLTTGPIPFISLAGWVMSPALLLELPLLPSWRMLMLRSRSGWLPQPEVYSTLLRLLPGSFCEVQLSHSSRLTPAHYESICMGAPVCHTPEAPFHIKLVGCEPAVATSIQHRMQELGVYPNVIVSRAERA